MLDDINKVKCLVLTKNKHIRKANFCVLDCVKNHYNHPNKPFFR